MRSSWLLCTRAAFAWSMNAAGFRIYEHKLCGKMFDPGMTCSECRQPLLAREVHVHVGPGAERGDRFPAGQTHGDAHAAARLCKLAQTRQSAVGQPVRGRVEISEASVVIVARDVGRCEHLVFSVAGGAVVHAHH
jgi:hypothetical protein